MGQMATLGARRYSAATHTGEATENRLATPGGVRALGLLLFGWQSALVGAKSTDPQHPSEVPLLVQQPPKERVRLDDAPAHRERTV